MHLFFLSDATIDLLVSEVTTVGKTLRVTCTMKDGETFVGWFDVKGNEVTARSIPDVFMKEKYYVDESGNVYTLVIQEIFVADGGNYTCKGNRTESTFALYVECKYLPMYYQFATFTFSDNAVCFSHNFLHKDCFHFLLRLMILFEKLKNLMQNFVGKANIIMGTNRESRKCAIILEVTNVFSTSTLMDSMYCRSNQNPTRCLKI